MALKGIKVIEFGGLAPGPFAGLILADHGASVIRVDRPFSKTLDVLWRGKRSIAINSKAPSGREVLKKLVGSSDVLIDPFRPGVMERLGLGPDVFLGKSGLNERLVYARVVGFPRTGPHKDMAGHDLNYLGLSGVLSMLPGSADKPSFPLNLLADFAGGGMPCAIGIILALLARNQSNKGQVVDADMVSGTRYLSSSPLIHHRNPSTGRFDGPRGTNLLDGGSPFYNIYACKDGGCMTLAAIEAPFYKIFLDRFIESLPENFRGKDEWAEVMTPLAQTDRDLWPKLRKFLEDSFLSRTRDEWASIFLGIDACCAPVLTPDEAGKLSNSPVPMPHPRVTGADEGAQTAMASTSAPCFLSPGQHTKEILMGDLGLDEQEYEHLLDEGIVSEVSPN